MTTPIVNPDVPYTGEIPDGWTSGKMVRIQGIVDPNADRFNINLQAGPNSKPRDDTSLHISVRLNQGYIARNTYIDGSWGDEQGNGRLPIGAGQHFEIIILNDPSSYKIAVNGQHYCEFPHRLPSDKVTHLLIDGDVHITVISYEGSRPVIDSIETATQASSVQNAGPQGNYGPPQGGYAPPQGGYAPPQGGYGPPAGGYAPQGYGPQQGYGMPPNAPGAPKESGMDNIMDTAQDILAGAIKSGVAEKLLSGIFSKQEPQQPGGFQPQNVQYGHYPQLPQQHQQQGPQFGGEGSVGGLGSVGNILGSLANSLFSPPKH
ncbi:galectin-4 isoform X2 [Aethina tumida]|uniref:galectin-4 isoform X2 n=1 Tax=Aethina tumida TaxID=116153 RepID=UPI00096B02E1|nr:galectin-4 isoform X2 [Aethina tumida]